MSIIRCEKHDRNWDSDKLDECPLCENEHVDEEPAQEIDMPFSGSMEHKP